jgi:hypothetical protein
MGQLFWIRKARRKLSRRCALLGIADTRVLLAQLALELNDPLFSERETRNQLEHLRIIGFVVVVGVNVAIGHSLCFGVIRTVVFASHDEEVLR